MSMAHEDQRDGSPGNPESKVALGRHSPIYCDQIEAEA